MGDAQSAQREREKDGEAEEEREEVQDAPVQHRTEDRPLRISGINGKADGTTGEPNGPCEDETSTEETLETAKQHEDNVTPLKNVDVTEKEACAHDEEDEEESLKVIEMDAKQNDINDSFRRFFSNIGLKLTVKRGSIDREEASKDLSDETNRDGSEGEDSDRAEDVLETAKETGSDQAQQNIDLFPQMTYDNDSTTCPTMTDITSEDILENAQEKTSESKEEAESDCVDTAATSPVSEEDKEQQAAAPEEELKPASSSSPETEEVVSPVKRFFTTGIFSSLRKKKKSTEEEVVEKELVEMGKGTAETLETMEQIQQDKEVCALNADAAKNETEQKDEIICAASADLVSEPEISISQEKVQDSPFKWLLSGSSMRRNSRKQRSRRTSKERLSDSGEHGSDQLRTPAKSAEAQKEQSPTQVPVEAAAEEEESAWASFKKLMTPKRHVKRPSLTNEELQIPASAGEAKPSDGEQVSDTSTEEGKVKRKDSSVSWEAVLCGSGKKNRSRKTSDSEDELAPGENDNKKQEFESSTESDGGSTWKSFKKLVTPKKKARDEEESKDNAQSDGEMTQDESSFSLKRFLSGRKKKKSTGSQEQASSDEVEKEEISGDEDSETPAVVPLSEFDMIETEVHIETQADVESHAPKEEEEEHEPQQDLLDEIINALSPTDSVQSEAKEVQDDENVQTKSPVPPASKDEPEEDLTESLSPHKLLSDIPEEGAITDTAATEEAARDDTIAEDLIEITSEAITAPEPVDETEMISAVSQLSESSNTSGNITPVLVEYDVQKSEALLYQVVETISMSPRAEAMFSEQISSQRIVGSRSYRILEKCVEEESRIVERPMGSNTVFVTTDLEAEEMDFICEDSPTAETESTSEVNEAVSTEMTSEAPTEDFVTAEIAIDEVHKVSISQSKGDVDKQESTDESQPLEESDANEAEALETQPEVELIHVGEDSLEAELAEESNDGGAGQEVEEQIFPNVADHAEIQRMQSENEELQAVQVATLDPGEGTDPRPMSVDGPAEEIVIEKTKETSQCLSECHVAAETDNKSQTDVSQTEPSEEPDVSRSTATLQDVAGEMFEKEVDTSEEEPVADKLDEEPEVLTEYKADEEQVCKTQFLGVVQSTTLESSPALEKEATFEGISAEETTADKSKEETEPLREDHTEAKVEFSLQQDAPQIQPAEEPEALEIVQPATLESEGSGQLFEEKMAQENISTEEPATGQPQEETETFSENDLEVKTETIKEDDTQEEPAREPEVVDAPQTPTLDLEDNGELAKKEVLSKDIPQDETVTEEPKLETEIFTEYDIKTETETQADVAHSEERATLEAEKDSVQTSCVSEATEDAPATESVTNENEPTADAANTDHQQSAEVVGTVDGATLDKKESSVRSHEEDVVSETAVETQTVSDQLREDVLTEISETVDDTETDLEAVEADVQSEQMPQKETIITELIEASEDNAEGEMATEHPQELATSTSAHMFTQVHPEEHENKKPSEDDSNAETTGSKVQEEPNQDLKLSEDQKRVKTPQDVQVTQEDHSPEVAEEITAVDVSSNSEAICVQIRENVPVCSSLEPLMESVVKELQFKDSRETATEDRSAAMTMNVPVVQVEDNHQIKVQVVDVEIKSAEAIVDTVLAVGITEVRGVLNVCEATVEEVEKLSATSETEEMIREENWKVVREVTQLVREEPMIVSVEEKDVRSDASEGDLRETEGQKVIKDDVMTVREITDESVMEGLMQRTFFPQNIEVYQDDKEESLERKTELDVTSEEMKLSSVGTKTSQEAQIPQNQIATPNTGLMVPQNTGIISSIGNLESPSSLSLEFKLNIQFAQTKEAASLQPAAERAAAEPVKKTDVSEVGIQAVEPEDEPETKQKATELVDVAVQGMEIVETKDAEAPERTVIVIPPVLLDVGMQTVETVLPEEPIKVRESETVNVQVTETKQPVLPEVHKEQTKAKEHIQENEQDVWMDAEEDIDILQGSPCEAAEPPESHTKKSQKRNTLRGPEPIPDVEMTPNVENKEEECPQILKKRGSRELELERECEDFAAAPAHSENKTTTIGAVEWD